MKQTWGTVEAGRPDDALQVHPDLGESYIKADGGHRKCGLEQIEIRIVVAEFDYKVTPESLRELGLLAGFGRSGLPNLRAGYCAKSLF